MLRNWLHQVHTFATRLPSREIRRDQGVKRGAVRATNAAQSAPSALRWEWFAGLPTPNRLLIGSGTLAIALSVLGTVVPPTVIAIASVAHPYTATGKQEACLSHLQALAQAMSLYTDDYDGHYPLEDNGQSGKARVTWVSLLGERTDKDTFTCPLWSVDDSRVQSGYGLNPVLGADSSLGAVSRSEVPHPDQTILLADRAEQHDVALLPPLPSWRGPSVPTNKAQSSSPDPCNLAFDHAGQANVLYADGHASPESLGAWLQEARAWGGTVAIHRSLLRLRNRNALIESVQAALGKGDEKTALALLAAHPAQTRKTLDQILPLWQASWTNNTDADGRDSDLDTMSWDIARAASNTGERGMLQAMNGEVGRQSQAELTKVQSGGWQREESDTGFSVERPAGWTVETREEGRYQRTYFHSGSSYVSVMVEIGNRNGEGSDAPIDWSGMERAFQQQLGRRYSRVQMNGSVLSNEAAGRWEFEIERVGEPRLRKVYLGRTHPWHSYVLVCTAPSAEWKQWQPIFERVAQEFSCGDR